MSTRRTAFFAALTAAAAAGCIESESEYTLNPDGSGKVTVRWVCAPVWTLQGGKDKDPDEEAKGAIRSELRDSKGVDCWKDVTYAIRNDGKVEFKGTAYFKDLEKLELHAQGYAQAFPGLRLSRDGKGGLVLGLAPPKPKEGEEKEPLPETEEQWKKRLRKERFEYQQSRPLFDTFFNNCSIKVTVTLPGEVGETAGFQKAAGNAVRHAVDGKAVVKALNDLMMDDARLREALKKGFTLNGDKTDSEEYRNEFLYGLKGPVRTTLKGGPTPAFDYAKEVDGAARKAHETLFATLGVEPPPAVVAAVPAPAPPPAAPAPQALEPFLRSAFSLDLTRPVPLQGERLAEEGFFDRLKEALGEHGYAYSLTHPKGTSSGSRSPSAGSFELRVEGGHVAELAWRTSGRSPVWLHLEQSPPSKTFRLVLRDDRRGRTAVLQAPPGGGVQLAVLRQGGASARSWASMEEAFRNGPAELGDVLAGLRSLALEVPSTPADLEFVRMALAWSEPLDPAVRRNLEQVRDRLGEDDPVAREAASRELSDLVGDDVRRLRVLAEFLRKADTAEVKARLEGVAAPRRRLLEAVDRIASGHFYRDLPYVASFWGSSEPDVDASARRRLAELCGRAFETRAEFDAWREANRGRLVWDEAAGRYRAGP
jgi:hypothetical protein